MECTRTFTSLDQGAKGRVVAIIVIETHDLFMVDIGDNFILPYPRLESLERLVHGVRYDAPGLAPVGEFSFQLYQAGPVHETLFVGYVCLRQTPNEILMCTNGIVVGIELNADSRPAPAP